MSSELNIAILLYNLNFTYRSLPLNRVMGALLSIPLLTGGFGAIGSSLCSGCLLFMGMYSRRPKEES